MENAVKIARAYTKRSGVITFGGAFHGRTLLTMALTGKVAPYKASFGPMPAEVFHAPYPVAYHGVSVQDSLDAMEHLFKWDIEPSRVAAIILEPVQGEGGFYAAPKEFLQALRKLCDEHGIVLVSDEIQAGFARTGKMFAIEHSGVKPDLITMAKSLAGGFPISAVTGKAEIMDAPHPGGLGGTYAGSPLGTAAALAVIEVIEEEKLCERSLALGDTMVKRLKAMQNETNCIGDVRQPGRHGCHGAGEKWRRVQAGCRPDQGPGHPGRRAWPDPALMRRTRQRDPFPGADYRQRRDRQRRPGYSA